MSNVQSFTDQQSTLQWPVAFAAGFIGVLALHQPMLGLLSSAGITQAVPYATRAVGPLGVPQFISAAFWGGIWGLVLNAASRRWPAGAGFVLKCLLFGMVFPTLVAWFVVAPIKGLPMAGGFKANSMVTGLCVNGAWGLGTGILLALYRRVRDGRTR
jgi:hypothetical protein